MDKKCKFPEIQIHQMYGLILFASVMKCGAMLEIAKLHVKKPNVFWPKNVNFNFGKKTVCACAHFLRNMKNWFSRIFLHSQVDYFGA